LKIDSSGFLLPTWLEIKSFPLQPTILLTPLFLETVNKRVQILSSFSKCKGKPSYFMGKKPVTHTELYLGKEGIPQVPC
jgi:hypothetical protein